MERGRNENVTKNEYNKETMFFIKSKANIVVVTCYPNILIPESDGVGWRDDELFVNAAA